MTVDQQQQQVTNAVRSGWCLSGFHASSPRGCRGEFQSIAKAEVVRLCPCPCHHREDP